MSAPKIANAMDPTPGLVERARRLAPRIAARAAENAKLRRLSDETWADLVESGLVRGLQPARWGGEEAPLADFLDAVAEVARADGAASWVLGIIGVHPWQTALFPEETQQEMWGTDARVMNSSSYAPTGKAERVPGGYRLSGRWSFSTGCDHCAWVNLGAIVGTRTVEGAEVPDFRSFLLPRSDYRIDDNWHVAGLSGTGSKDVVVDGAFVPDPRSQSHWDYALGVPLPGWERNDGPLYRLPWAVVFNGALGAAVIGAAAGFLDAWTEESRTRKAGFAGPVAEDPAIQQLLAEARYTIDAARLHLRADAEEMTAAASAGSFLSFPRRAEIRYHICRSAQLCLRIVDDLLEASSGRTVFLDHPLQRRFQDVKAMCSHAYLKVEPPARHLGRMTLGEPRPDVLL